MLSPREKALIVVAYYKGTADNDIGRGHDPKEAQNISVECGEKILDELGLHIDFVEDFEDFMKQLDVITGILIKENDQKLRFDNSQRKPVFCRICQREYIDFCSKHCNIPDSWEVRE